MSTVHYTDQELFALLDAYLDEYLDEPQLVRLEAILLASGAARAIFVRYCRMETDLHLAVRSQRAGERAMRFIEQAAWQKIAGVNALPKEPLPVRRSGLLRLVAGWQIWAAVAACLVLAASMTWKPESHHQELVAVESTVAWLVNAQECQWLDQKGQGAPAGRMHAGEVLALEKGLAEIQFGRGAKTIVQGPARLELLTDNSLRLTSGKLAARVSAAAHGFAVLMPQGKIVDLGTEFGVAVDGDGTSEIYVFQGHVEAYGENASLSKVAITENQAARVTADNVIVNANPLGDAHHFVRTLAVAAAPAPRVLDRDFRRAMDSSIRDIRGLGVGLDERLPGTGSLLAPNDRLLILNIATGRLDIAIPFSRIEEPQDLDQGEYIGARLSSLGFKGQEDFEVTMHVSELPLLNWPGTFGVYAGTDARHTIRAGLISQDPGAYNAMVVSNENAHDSGLRIQGSVPPRSDVTLTLRRLGGSYSFAMDNQTDGARLVIRAIPPAFLDNKEDLYVGIFAARQQTGLHTRLSIDHFSATVWPEKSAHN